MDNYDGMSRELLITWIEGRNRTIEALRAQLEMVEKLLWEAIRRYT